MRIKHFHIILINLLLLAGIPLMGQTTVTITSSGTWTVPAGVTSINLYLWGGGGAGGGSSQTSQSFFSNGGGGGGGACAVNTSITVTPGQVWTV
ncbi:MAG TPA: hypothetical protein VNZ45_12960, partial [Bacteroidia bacterium]|nr:hypothetical protein [Bacteroidia bacterium]